MSPESLAALLVSLGTFIGALAVAYRGMSGDRFTRRINESAALLSGYTEMVTNLRKELESVRAANIAEEARRERQHRTELDNLAAVHRDERAHWAEERQRLEERVELLEAQVFALVNRPGAAGGGLSV